MNQDAMSATKEITDKVVVITGSSSGIGQAVGLGIGERGATVVFNGRSAERLSKTFKMARERGIRAIAVRADVATAVGAKRLIDRAFKTFGRVDVLVNNAGIGGPFSRSFWEIKPAEFDVTIATNLRAALLCASAYVKALHQRRAPGRIVNVSSTAASRGYVRLSCYCASKFGLRGLTECMALDVKGSGIVVTSLELASHRTPMMVGRLPKEDYDSLLIPDDATGLFFYAATGPAELLHGRTISEVRYRTDAEAEVRLNSSVATVAPWVPYLPRYASSSRPYARALHMDFLENPEGPPAMARAAVRRSSPASLARYPDPQLRTLRTKLAARLELPSDCFTFGIGSTELIDQVLRTFAQPGDSIVATDPTWPVFERMCRMHGLGLVRVPHCVDRSSASAQLNLDDVLRAVDSRTRLVYLVSPNNVLGTSIAEREFRRFLERLRPNLPVLVDEAYIEYCDQPDVVRVNRMLCDTDKPLIGTRTFSKFFGLAGMRVGYAYASPATLGLITRVQFPFSVSGVAEGAAAAALDDPSHAERTRITIRHGREQLRKELTTIGLRSLASDANFLMAELPADADVVYDALSKRRIFLPEVVWNGFMQLPIGKEDDNRRYLEVLANVWGSQHG